MVANYVLQRLINWFAVYLLAYIHIFELAGCKVQYVQNFQKLSQLKEHLLGCFSFQSHILFLL